MANETGGDAPPGNHEIAEALRDLAGFLEMDRVPFKPRAMEKASFAIEALDRPVAEIHAEGGVEGLEEIPGVGEGIAKRVDELIRTGRIEELEKRRDEVPVDLPALTSVEGLGPQRVRVLFDALGIRTLDDLEAAARGKRIRKVKGFGERSERKLLEGIELVRQIGGRRLISRVLPIARRIEARLRDAQGVFAAKTAGSLRRRRETVGDADFLVAADDPDPVMERFTGMEEVDHVYARGPTKALVRLTNGLDADLRVVKPSSWGAALLYFTGSKAHNIALRRIAMRKDRKLSEYGLFRDGDAIAGETEEEVYAALGLPWIPPELREDSGEIEAALEDELPELIPYETLRGDLQIQTTWTDGAASIEEMALAAKKLGRRYIAITDHTRDLAMARGAGEEKLRRQAKAIRALNEKLDGIRVLSGAEVNIREDGTLDVADDALAELDVVGAAVHTRFDLPRERMTARLVRAIENPHVDVLFHPSSRSIGRRRAVDADWDEVIAAARRTGTWLEVDAQPHRLDLDDAHVRKAVEAGVKLVIDSDAHTIAEMEFPEEFGIAQARRGWARREDVLNTRSVEDLLAARKRP